MILKKNISILLAVILCTAQIMSQVYEGPGANRIFKGASKVIYNAKFQTPVFVQFSKESGLLVNEIENWIMLNYKIGKEFSFKLIKKENNPAGLISYKFQQLYKDIPVQGYTFEAVTNSGKVVSLSSHLLKNLSIQTEPKYNESSVSGNLVNYVKEKKYYFEKEKMSLTKSLNKEIPKGKLTILQKDFSYFLVYKYDFLSLEPYARKYIYVDAGSKKIIHEASCTCDCEELPLEIKKGANKVVSGDI